MTLPHSPIIAVCAAALAGAAPPQAAPRDAHAYVRDQLHLARYTLVAVDLNGDHVPELLVHAEGPDDCGSGGCDLYILARRARGYRVVTQVSVTRPPIRLLPGSSHGWRDIGVEVAGGGIVPAYEARLRFDGRTYPTNPTVLPAESLPAPAGRIVIR